MCQQCTTHADLYQPFDGFLIAVATVDWENIKKGNWGLVICNNPEFWSTIPLEPEPKEEDHSEEADQWYENYRKFIEEEFYLRIHVAYNLIEAMKKVGLKDINDASLFFINYISNYIKNNPPLPK